MRFSWGYMLASRRNGTLYVGVMTDLVRRVAEHRSGALPGFTSGYGVKRLVWLETHESLAAATRREKRLKVWQRAWKVRLVGETNPEWRDLWPDILGVGGTDAAIKSRHDA